jgi:hypothetical protein
MKLTPEQRKAFLSGFRQAKRRQQANAEQTTGRRLPAEPLDLTHYNIIQAENEKNRQGAFRTGGN